MALVSQIQHFCVHDGNGFRTTVFLQGCPLRCRWCQNPELQAMHVVHMYNASACVHCLNCVKTCHRGILDPEKNGFRPLEPKACYACSELKTASCVQACAYGARNLSARLMSVEDVLAECWKESAFWGDGGGITLSGGEPLMQLDFCCELGRRCRELCTDLAIETCGYVPWEHLERISDFVDTFLYDLKLVTPDLRKEWLGVKAELDLENLRRLTGIHDHVVLRIPLIPNVNDTESEFGAILRVVEKLVRICHLHLLPFHQFGSNKYNLAGMAYSLAEMATDNEEAIARCCYMAETAGFNVDLGGKAFTSSGEGLRYDKDF